MDHVENIARTTIKLADEIGCNAIMVITETGQAYNTIMALKPSKPVIVITASDDIHKELLRPGREGYVVKLPTRSSNIMSEIEDAIVHCVGLGILMDGDSIIALGSTTSQEANSILFYQIRKEGLDFELYEYLKKHEISSEVFESVLNIALDIGKEGREGRLIGTAFLIGDSKAVMNSSRQLILNPFKGQAQGERMITNPEIKETIKELAQLDGAFVIDNEGLIKAAGRYLNVDTSIIEIPRGLGSRHAAVASITATTRAIGITVSQSGGIVRIFKDGKAVITVEPQKRFSFKS